MNVALKVVKTKAEEEFAEHFAKVSEGLPGNDKITALRNEAMGRFEGLGLPHRRVEEWKYTDLKANMRQAFAPASGADSPAVSADQLTSALGALGSVDCIKIVFVNGVYNSALSEDISALPVSFSPVAEALAEGIPAFVNSLGNVNPPEPEQATIALNTAFMSDGAFLRIDDDIAKPLNMIFVTAGEHSVSIATRNVIHVVAGVSVTLMETHVSLSDVPAQNNTVTELDVEDGAQVHHVKVQMENTDTAHIASWMVRLGGDAVYKAFQFTTGGAISRNQLFAKFVGEDTKLNISGAALLRGKQHADMTLVVDHAVPSCESREFFKAVLDDETRGVFQGKVIVRPHAQKTDGSQMSQALLLSETSEFDSKPELEIFADDVVCGHGATSGQIDEELLFYLRARGLPEQKARAMLISAFVGEVLEELENDDIRESLTEIAGDWLSSSFNG